MEALKRCGRDLTRERLVAELEGLMNFQGISGMINYKPFNPKDPYGSRQGVKEVFLIECMDGGKAKKLTDWTVVDFRM